MAGLAARDEEADIDGDLGLLSESLDGDEIFMRPFEVCWKGVEFGSVWPSRKWSGGIPLTFLLHGPNQRASTQGCPAGKRFAARMVEHA